VPPRPETPPAKVAPPSPTLAVVSLPPTAAPLRFVAGVPPQATVGRPDQYSFCGPTPSTATSARGPFPQTTDPTGGSPPYHFQLGSGVGFPPIGMSIGKDGLLTGTPASPGTYTFEVCAVDLSATQVRQRATIAVRPPVAVATAAPTPVPTAALTRTPTPPTIGALASKTCTPSTGGYYRITRSGTVSGPVGSRVALASSNMTCPGWTPSGPDCRRTSDSQPEPISWTATTSGLLLGDINHPDLWSEGPGTTRQAVNIRCP